MVDITPVKGSHQLGTLELDATGKQFVRIDQQWQQMLDLMVARLNAFGVRLDETEGELEEKTFDVYADEVTDVEGSLLKRGASDWEGLAPGTDGQVLAMSSGAPAWSTQAAPITDISGGYIAIPSSTNLDIALPSQYSMIEIEFVGATPTSDAFLQAQYSQDGGSSYLSGASDYGYAFQRAVNGDSWDSADSKLIILRDVESNAASGGVTCTIRIFKPGDATVIKRFWSVGTALETGGDVETYQSGGQFNANTDAIDHVRFFWSAGDFRAQGFYAVRGYN